MSRAPACRVAIVGFGPRGFGCLERLALELARHGSGRPPLFVTAHDPRRHPGAGPLYDPDQPECLLLNFSVQHVNIWSRDHDLVPRGERLDFLAWLGRNHSKWASSNAFVPRRLLGLYLRDSLASLVAALPADLRFRQVRGEVQDLTFSGGGWSIHHDDSGLDLAGVHQVMVATGHGTWSRDVGFESWNQELPPAPKTRRISSVYPVGEHLSREAIPTGSVVGVRGFGLTAIDAALALTVGRGGTFEERESGVGPYRGPSGDDLTIVPFSRSGHPPLAKPGAALVKRSNELITLWEPLRKGIRDADDLTLGALLQRLHRAGLRAVSALGGRAAGAHSEGIPSSPSGPLEVMERSVLVATGMLPPDEAWARGEVWRQAFPAVASRASDGGLAATFPAAFARLACVMERYAFGPPASNLARMVALSRAGRLELRAVRAPKIDAREGRLVLWGKGAPISIDVLVNAVVPPPGVHADTPLLMQLMLRGHASQAPGWNSVRISPSAASLGRDGLPTPGLSVVGRATEGWVVGNDTLSRTLHAHIRRWAERVVLEADVPAPRVHRFAVKTPS